MTSQPSFIIGTSGWLYPNWRGRFYPETLTTKNWFDYYQNKFNLVEINATFYRQFKPSIYKKWAANARSHFKYVIKVPGYITHKKLLKNCKKEIKQFCKSARLLKSHFGLFLLQLSPRMPYDINRLKEALNAFDNPKKVVVEFRNDKWLTQETKKLLKDFQCIYCIVDSPHLPMKTWITAKAAYLRLHGHNQWYNYNYSHKELQKIASLAQRLNKKGAQKVYILFNNDYFAYAAKNAMYLQKKLNI